MAVSRGRTGNDDRWAAWKPAAAQETVDRERTPSHAVAPRPESSGGYGAGARAFLLLLYAAQVGQAFVPAPQRTGLEACLYLSRTRYTKWRNALAGTLPSGDGKTVAGREGTQQKLRGRFAAIRVRRAPRDYRQSKPHEEEWWLIEWPAGEPEPAKYWLSTLPAAVRRADLVKLAQHRGSIEPDYEELQQELGRGHFEGRGWRGFHHHGTLGIAADGFLVAERSRFFPSARGGHLHRSIPRMPAHGEPRGAPGTSRTASSQFPCDAPRPHCKAPARSSSLRPLLWLATFVTQ